MERLSRQHLVDEKVLLGALNIQDVESFLKSDGRLVAYVDLEIAMCSFPRVTDAYDVAIVTMMSGIQIASDNSGSDFIFAKDPEAKKELQKIRKEAIYACLQVAPGIEAMTTDVCVPLSHLAELISKSKVEIDALPLLCYDSTVIAHVGDGNLHTVILFNLADDDQRKEAKD
uniref:D-lactate dehydrogenase [cytochrome], mitochondrial n=1 Tax=Tanacetum cinerariifolium TaxID=118510 RepID=A0A6L2NP51_TANCI|nr:D-lactate dehydrogenase [cytochrome], mitochondrial [Tanacetum cinerariifolium]